MKKLNIHPLGFLATGTLGVALAACAADTGTDTQELHSGAASQALAADENSTYFRLRPDLRRCASPLCGGFFVQRVNQRLTTCADGRSAPECYVAELDLSKLGLSAEQVQAVSSNSKEFLLKGAVLAKRFAPFGNLGTFLATEAWRGHVGVSPEGTFFRARNNGIVCVTFPCPSFDAARLNLPPRVLRVAGVDLEGIAKDVSDGIAQLSAPEGLLTAAQLVTVTGPAGSAVALDATEFYLPFLAEPRSCGGFTGRTCGDDEFCDIPPEFDCGIADGPGVCRPRPAICTQEFDPVCGCDGRTYGNACEAARAGVSIDFEGECPRQ